MTHELKPCPFCGGPAAAPDENNHTSCTTISCGSTAYMSAAAWNRRAMSEWKPIETAPKDGTWVLVFTAEDFDNTDFRTWETYPKIAVAHLDDGKWWESGTEPWGMKPTHWMPLPAPPIIRVEGETQ